MYCCCSGGRVVPLLGVLVCFGDWEWKSVRKYGCSSLLLLNIIDTHHHCPMIHRWFYLMCRRGRASHRVSEGRKRGLGEADNLARRELLGRRLPHIVGPAKQGVEVRVRQAGRVGGLLLVLDGEGYRGVLKRRLRRNHCSLTEALDLQLVSNF